MRRALDSVDGIADLETDIDERSCSFSAPADLDVAAVLNKFAEEGNKHIAGWSKADDKADDKAAPADGDGAATSKKSGTQAVSLKLPGMT